ncbi:hypothetical protein ZIOFF_012556 [Zingiber officinale]|uniref:DUF632 domain-containing protein n=1 Tax=Zingiber officinale TaxID=94328 RepID=A0A8J5M3H6_ZINOF|nr:hypothetical protein ZIOFF_012556 [Zingiber officinale]
MFRVGRCLTGRFEHTGDEFQATKKCQSFDSYQQRSAVVVTGYCRPDKNVVGGAREDLNQKKLRPLPNAASSLEPGVPVADKNAVTEMKEQDKAVGFTFSRRYQDIAEQNLSCLFFFPLLSFPLSSFCKDDLWLVSSFNLKIDDLLVFEEDEVIGTGYLSSTLQKIYNWELKLLEEVMVEEKMRVLYNRIFRTWTVLSKCHHIQCQAISEAKNLDSNIDRVKLNDHMDEIKRLEMAIVDLVVHFSGWFTAQRSYLKSLNDWLMKGVCSIPEETDDGIAPFSPRKLGAPSIFVVCNYWYESVDVISERNVLGAMKVFAHIVFKLWQQRSLEQQQSLIAIRDMDSKLRLMARDEQLMVKHKNKLMLISSEIDISVLEHVYHGSTMISFQSKPQTHFWSHRKLRC